jgi:hypothetical protein
MVPMKFSPPPRATPGVTSSTTRTPQATARMGAGNAPPGPSI